jgi:hypothetical protein
MKGKLTKTEKGWMVNYKYSVNKNDWETLPLHPDFIELMDTCFTSKFTQDVEFEMVLCSHSKSKDDCYAKLINHSVDSNEMIEDDVYKLAELEYPIFDGDLLGIAYNQKQSRIDFIKGYNKAIESQLPQQQEISDEEIEKFADEELGTIRTDFDFGVIQGMKWYREQLKQKQ